MIFLPLAKLKKGFISYCVSNLVLKIITRIGNSSGTSRLCSVYIGTSNN